MWRQTVRPLRLAPTMHRNIAHGKVKNILNRTLCPRALCAESKITAQSTEVAPVSVTSWKRNFNLKSPVPNQIIDSIIIWAECEAEFNPPIPPKPLHDYPPMSPGNTWSRHLNFVTTLLPEPPPQLYSLNEPRNLPFVPRADSPQLH
jgi:hypothetical protein